MIAAVALALRLCGPGPLLHREERIGRGGRLLVVRSFAITEAMCESAGWRLLARIGVTALPQLWSVLAGRMSIVGPRPREPGFEAPPARSGLTGLAQLEQLVRWLSVAEQLELDEHVVAAAGRADHVADAYEQWRRPSTEATVTPPG